MMTLIAFLIIIVAGVFQGTFILPMAMTKGWKWENSWFIFSVMGMIVLNLLLALLTLPNLFNIYGSVASSDIIILSLLGFGWGCGSVLFGIGMDRLGMSLGYPIIMGLIATLGAILPLVLLNPSNVASTKGILLLCGAAVAVYGIIRCTKANALKQSVSTNTEKSKNSGALIIAIAAGVLSCFPNIGASFGGSVIQAAQAAGAPTILSGNAVWALFFTVGFIPNAIYTLILLSKNGSYTSFRASFGKNITWGVLMGAMWIGSFYLYGIGAAKLGEWGLIIGWPLYIALSIIVGNLWGIWKGEWVGASKEARANLNMGIAIIVMAMVIIGLCNFF